MVSGIPVLFKERLKGFIGGGWGRGVGRVKSWFGVGRRRVLTGGGGRGRAMTGGKKKWSKSVDFGRINVLGRWEGDERDDEVLG